jgi:hypothetical protein
MSILTDVQGLLEEMTRRSSDSKISHHEDTKETEITETCLVKSVCVNFVLSVTS